jgi:hypothetical protein
MRSLNQRHLKLLGAALAAGAIALPLAATSPASAQHESWDAAWQRCTNMAQQQYPNSEATTGRVAVFKSCMSRSGHRP